MNFTSRGRKAVRIQHYSRSENAPPALDPHMLDEVLKYAFVPDKVTRAYRGRIAAAQQPQSSQ